MGTTDVLKPSDLCRGQSGAMIPARATAGLVQAVTATLLLTLGIGCGVADEEVASGPATILLDEAHFNRRMPDLKPFTAACTEAGYSLIRSREPLTQERLDNCDVVAIVGAVRTDIHTSVSFAPDSRTIALAGDDYTIGLWEIGTPRQVAALRSDDWIGPIAFAQDGKTLASANASFAIELWDVQSRSLRRVSNGFPATVRALAFSPDGGTLAAGGDHHAIYVWDAETGQRLSVLDGPGDAIHSIAFSSDGETLASGGTDGAIWLWNLRKDELTDEFSGVAGTIRSLVYSPNGLVLASGGDRPGIELWDVAAGEHVLSISSDTTVYSLAFSPDGKVLASGGHAEAVRLWDPGTGEAKAAFVGHRDWIRSVAFSPDGKIVASVDDDEIAKLWNVETGELIQSMAGRETFQWDRGFAFSEKECDALRNWVLQGGGLLLVTDHAPYGAAVANLAERFGVTLSNSHSTRDSLHYDRAPVSRVFSGEGNKSWLSFTRDAGLIQDHPVTRGRDASERIDRVATFVGNSLKGPAGSTPFLLLSPSAVDVFRNNVKASAAGRAQGVALEFGKGRVVVLGEMGMLMVLDRTGYDNRQLALNIVQWLADSPD